MTNDDFRHLDSAGQATAAIAVRPRGAVYAVVGGGVVLSWAMLAAMAASTADLAGPGSGGPGAALLEWLPDLPLPAFLERFFALCLTATPAAGSRLATFAALSAMWLLMSVAMMLPSAVPLIRTYCEIADTARAKGEPAAHPLILVSGYLSVWLAASLVFAAVTAMVRVPTDSAVFGAPLPAIAGAAALFLAGLYQFSGFKEACLKKCRNPFNVLFARWSPRPMAIYRLGAEQGLWCLGCCWALMLVMFAVGIANVFWMALIALFTLVEKQSANRLPTRAAGAILLVWAASLLLTSN